MLQWYRQFLPIQTLSRSTALECFAKNTRDVASRWWLWYAIQQLEDRSSSSTDIIVKSEEDIIMATIHSTIRQPSAFLPVAMSLVALALVLGHIAIFGVVHETDEGAVAHIWQILMAAQVPIIAFFAIKYLPQKPTQALLVLTLQIVLVVTACAPVFLLKL